MAVLLEENLICDEARNAGDVTGKALGATRSLVTVVHHDVTILKNGYFTLVHVLTEKFQTAQLESVATTRQLSEEQEKIGELELKVPFLTDDFVAIS